MISSPGAVIASTACTNAMFAPAVTMMRVPRVTSIPFSARSFTASCSTSAGSPAPSWYSCVEASVNAPRTASSAAVGGP